MIYHILVREDTCKVFDVDANTEDEANILAYDLFKEWKDTADTDTEFETLNAQEAADNY